MANKINKISAETIQKIKQKSVLYVPDRPGEKGMTAAQLKQAFVGLVTDSNNSTIAEVNRMADELNDILAKGFVGIYETLPEIDNFALKDIVILVDGSIYQLIDNSWVKLSLSKQDILDIETALNNHILAVEADLNNVKIQTNTNTDNIADLDTRITIAENVIPKKLDKETITPQIVKGNVDFEEGIKTTILELMQLKPRYEVAPIEVLSDLEATNKSIIAGDFYKKDAKGDHFRLATENIVNQKITDFENKLAGGELDEALDTLKEIQNALNNDPDFANTMINELSKKVDKTITINNYPLSQNVNLTKADIGLANVDNTSDLDKPISTATQLVLDQKASNADLAPVLNLVNLGLFTLWGTNDKTINSIDLVGDISSQLQIRDYNFPLSVGIQHTYTVDDITYTLTLTDSPILYFMGEVIYYGDGKGKITIWKSSISATPRTNTETYVKYIRNNDESNWERIAYTSDLEEIETVINNELATMDTKIEANKNTIDNIISGDQLVGKALEAVNIVSETRAEVEDEFNVRITATNNNEIVSAIGDESTAEITEIGGFSVKQIVKDNETTCELAQNNIYLAKANGTDITLSNGTQTINLTNGVAKFTANADGTYIFNGTNLANCKVYSLTEMGIANLSLEQVNQLLGYKVYPFGITNTKPKTFKSIGENLWDYKYFYDTLKAVNADNISYVEKDGRECIKINNPGYYHNKGIELYKGKFAPNVRYRLIAEGFNETNQNLYLRYVYTDSTYSTAFQIPTANTEKWHVSDVTSLEGKTIDYITISLNYNYPTYLNISKFQLQMLDNPETNFLPYTSNIVEIPQVYESYGMPSLPNGVRDRIIEENSKWRFEKNVGKVILDGSEGWIAYTSNVLENCISFSFTIGITHLGGGGSIISGATIASHTFVNGSFWERDEEVYNFRNNGNIYFNIKKSRLTGYQEDWTNPQKVNAFKDWLSQNPLEIYYQLAEPISTPIPSWYAKYLAYNYGREEMLDENGNTIPTHAVIKYYLDNKKQIETNTTNIADLLARVQALENK